MDGSSGDADLNEGSGRSFFLVWGGQVISLLGSQLTTFGLGVWAFQRSGAVTDLSWLFLATSLPGLLLAPVAGVYIDRWDRRRGLIATNLGAAVGPLALAALVFSGRLEIWSLCAVNVLYSAFVSFQIPAFGAAVSLLVPRRQYARASGLMQLGGSTARVAGPLLGGLLVPFIHLHGLLLLDCISFLVGVVSLLAARIPNPPPRAGAAAGGGGSLASEVAWSGRYLAARPGLLSLLGFFALLNLMLGMAQVLATPLVLANGTPTALGAVLTVGGLGMVAGSLVMSAWGGPRRRILGVLGWSPVLGAGCILIGATSSAVGIAAGIAVVFFAVPVINACDQAIWQSKVEPAVQGRVFATRQLLEQITIPIAFLAAGPLADRVFTPLLAPGGALAGSVGRVLGTGPGRGIGFFFIVLGTLLALIAVGGLLYPRLRSIDSELPDAGPAAEPAAVALGAQA